MVNLDFLIKCHLNLFHYLNQLLETKKHCACFILSNEYHCLERLVQWERLLCIATIKHKEEHDNKRILISKLNWQNQIFRCVCVFFL